MRKIGVFKILILCVFAWANSVWGAQPLFYQTCLTDDARLTAYYQPRSLLDVLHRYSNPTIVPEPGTLSSDQLALLTYQARGLSSDAISTALKAYYHADALGYVKQHILTVVDYTQPSDQPRLWVFNLDNNRAIFHTWVTHGTGSGDRFARRFSNQDDSHASSLGVIVTGDTYKGVYGYSLNLYGVERGINDNIYKRRIVVHPADYVGSEVAHQYNEVGKSFGCLAVNTKIAHELIDDIKGGSIIVDYYPDRHWLAHSPFLNNQDLNTQG